MTTQAREQSHLGIDDVAWLASTGKLGGQRKVPRLNNNRTTIDQMLELMHNS